jgi:transposase
MTTEEEVQQENKYLRERVRLQQEKIELQQRLLEQQETLLTQQHALIEGLLTQVGLLEEQVQVLQERLNKDSHNSHLPPSSDRFGRQPKSLRKKSGKKPRGQIGHAGNTLKLPPTPDQVIMHPVDCCQHCQRDLREVESLAVERHAVR